ncbi:MAG: NAD(+)/NADH kinase [Anaerolineae bacterium]|nr:NAD(+)/NADH kinase [Anaerolineae bacterium]
MTASFQRVGVLAHPLRPQSAPVAESIAAFLETQGVLTWVYTRWDDDAVRERIAEANMVIAIGGDGAMLRAARVCAAQDVPVLGVNMGQLGFLTEISGPDSWEAPLRRILNGDQWWIEERMMIQAALLRGDRVVASGDALNDIVISRGTTARMIWLETYIDQDWATTYNADALIIATATGSTAYALACGGPILPPELRNILIVPVAPHLSMDRPIVLSEGSTVEVAAPVENLTEIVLTVDGVLMGVVQPGDRVRVQAGQHVCRFVRLRERNYFYRSLLDRLEPRQQVRSKPEGKA